MTTTTTNNIPNGEPKFDRSSPFATINHQALNEAGQGLVDNEFHQFKELVENICYERGQFWQQFFQRGDNLIEDCGYPSYGELTAQYFRTLYDMSSTASRVVEVLPKESWQVTPIVYEDEDPENQTPFEQAWDDLGQHLRGENCWYQDEVGSPVWEYLERADIISGIGYFGILLIGVDDGRNLDQPADGVMTEVIANYSNPQRCKSNLGRLVADESPIEDKLDNGYELTANQRTTNSHIIVNNKVLHKTVRRCADGVKRIYYAPRETTHNASVQGKQFQPRTGEGREPSSDLGKKNFYDESYAGASTPHTDPANLWPNPDTDDAQSGAYDSSNIFGSSGRPPGYPQQGSTSFAGAQGTDAQYVGIQLSPPQYPSEEPAQEPHKILFLRPFSEDLVQIVQYEADVRNPRYGFPVMYLVTLNDPREQHSGVGLPMATVRVHWSRVIHLADNLRSSEIFGIPRLRPVVRHVLDLDKLYGGSAEMYYRGAFPGLSIETHPQLGGDVQINKPALDEAMNKYSLRLSRYLALMGMSAKSLAPQVVDPTPQIDVHIKAICIHIPCPKRVFEGSERGELASAQDDSKWNEVLTKRENMYLTPKVIVPLIDRLISMGVLPIPNKGRDNKIPDIELTPPAQGGDEQQGQSGGSDASSAFGVDNDGEQGGEDSLPPGPAQPKTGDEDDEFGQQGKDEEDADTDPPSGSKMYSSGFSNNTRSNTFGKRRRRTTRFAVINKWRDPRTKRWVERVTWNEEQTTIEDDPEAEDFGEEKTETVPMTGMRVQGRGGYSIVWPDLDSTSKKDKAAIAGQITTALGAYIQGGVQALIPPFEYLTNVCGFPDDEVRSILASAEKHKQEETSLQDAMAPSPNAPKPQIPMGFDDDGFPIFGDNVAPAGPNPPPEEGGYGQMSQGIDEEIDPNDLETEDTEVPESGEV